MEKALFDEIADLEAISAQMLLLYEGVEAGAFSASREMQSSAIDGIRRYLLRIIDELKQNEINSDFDSLVPRQEVTIIL